MVHLIDKDALVAEINNRIDTCTIKKQSCPVNTQVEAICDNKIHAYKELLSFLDTLEVKEVDLEKHLKEDIEDVFFDLDGVAVKGATHYLTVEDVKDIAKHFFELGLKAKGE